jgi:hypothetical protein
MEQRAKVKKTMAKSGVRGADMFGVRGSEFGSKNSKSEIHDPKSRGVSIIAALFIIMILAFMGLVFLSFISTSSFTSLNNMQSAQALSVAEGGLEYILANRTFPNYSMSGATLNLGAGSFTISTPASLTVDPGAAGTTITVQSTANFPNTGRIIIDSELIDYTGKTATTFNPATRGVGGTFAVAHAVGNAVYPVTTVTDNPLAVGSTTINVASNVGFSIPGTIIIDTEYISCSGVNGTTQFTNCTRGYRGSPATAHPNAGNVFQYALTSVGTVGNGQREVVRSVRRIPGAMMVYAKANGNGTPYYRRWDGTSWGPELTASSVGAGRTIYYMVLKFARASNEAVLGTLDSTGDVQVQIWNGASWGAPTLMGNTTAANSIYRGFDIEYETNGDRALVVYNTNVANQVSYRVWSGLAWSAQANQALAAVSIGVPYWIELAPNPLAASSEIAMIVLGSNVDVYGLRWTGAGWNNMGDANTWDNSASTATRKAIDVAYEQISGRAMFIWGDSTTLDRQRYRIWNGATATLSGIVDLDIAYMRNNVGAADGLAYWVKLAPDPFSNNIMYSVQDSGLDLNTRLWNGAAWDTAAQHPEHDTGTESNDRNSDVVFETAVANAGRAWLLWGNGATVSRRQWNGAAWGAITTTGDDTSLIQLLAHPITGAIFSGIYENSTSATDDIWESHLTSGGATWSAKFTAWGGPTVASPVMERLFIAAERYNPLIAPDWREISR